MDIHAVYTIVLTCALANPSDMMGERVYDEKGRFEYAMLDEEIKKKKKKGKKLAQKGKKKKKGFFSKVFGSK
tara:strand:+ start:320 stop:535 length:216 start_codon:yes stop_codon:yes gene_type:complete